MKKISFEIVNLQVEDLFVAPFNKGETVDDRLIKIEKFIEACGWKQEEFELFRLYGLLN